MKSQNNLTKNIERLGERYCRRYLDSWDNKKLQNDWWEALMRNKKGQVLQYNTRDIPY